MLSSTWRGATPTFAASGAAVCFVRPAPLVKIAVTPAPANIVASSAARRLPAAVSDGSLPEDCRSAWRTRMTIMPSSER
jgi:hypothetical protein